MAPFDIHDKPACLANILVLDLDGSVSLPGMITRLDLRSYEEKVRYYAGFGDMAALERAIEEEAGAPRIVFLGSGDFHHISYLLIKHMPQTVQVIVFDNHPDNMFFPAGIHCGSWVYHASKLPNVSNIAVFGIASRDIAGPDLFQNRFSVIKAGKVKYYCLAPVSKLAKLLGGPGIEDISASQKSMAEIVERHVRNNGSPVYLSIDKDVLAHSVVGATWDQGKMREDELLTCIGTIAPKVIAADVAGDISSYNYRSFMKRLMRRLDGYEPVPGPLEEARLRHGDINMKIVSLLEEKKGTLLTYLT